MISSYSLKTMKIFPTPPFFLLSVILIGSLFISSQLFALESVTGLQSTQYVHEKGVSPRLDLELSGSSKKDISQFKPDSEFHFTSFFEPGANGDYSADIDQTAVRWKLSENVNFVVGRVHPLLENQYSDQVSPVSALGSVWVQNQSDALFPRVVGWVGVGGSYKPTVEGAPIFTAYFSPLFLPTFSSRMQLSETDAPAGGRFARLPPQNIKINDTLLPLRYDLNVGSLSEILLQPQAYFSMGWFDELHFQAIAWSAPSPNPTPDLSGKLKVTEEDAKILVEVQPRFLRENFFGFLLGADRWLVNPEIQSFYETQSKRIVFSTQIVAFKDYAFGYLHTFETAQAEVQSSGSIQTTESGIYANHLVWMSLDPYSQKKWSPSLRVERSFNPKGEGMWLRPLLTYRPEKQISLFLDAKIIAAQENNYFGAWRHLDSTSAGLRWLW